MGAFRAQVAEVLGRDRVWRIPGVGGDLHEVGIYYGGAGGLDGAQGGRDHLGEAGAGRRSTAILG